MTKRILITGVGGPSPRSFAIALKKYSVFRDYELIATDTNKYSVGLYNKELFSHSYVIPRADNPEYWQVIRNIVNRHKIDYAVVLPEVEVLEWSKLRLTNELPCKSLIADYSLNRILIDKAEMTKLLEPVGLAPRSIEFDRDNQNFDSVFEKLGNNFWIRGTVGTSGMGSLRINDRKQLSDWIKINPNVQKFIASEYLPGRNLACKMLYHNGDLLRSACGERVYYIMSKVVPSGITGNTAFGRLLNDEKVFNVAKSAMDVLFKHTGASKHGFFTVDLKEDENGNPLVTEVNIRHVAFSQCFAAKGANFAEDTIMLLNDDPTFDRSFKRYLFEEGLIFLRDVDTLPIIMKEKELLEMIQ
ncbi:MAG: hypothetical protein L6Q59_04445 [Ignavibacteriaceae bacterium]|nr:hypothetical protein [Ignavibacteriaceae bacterium]MCK6615936.1 hypothetical protein [Ignavibacteriaceae bacterium]